MLPDLETLDELLEDDTTDEVENELDDFADLEDEEEADDEVEVEEPEPRSRAQLDDESLRVRGFFDRR